MSTAHVCAACGDEWGSCARSQRVTNLTDMPVVTSERVTSWVSEATQHPVPSGYLVRAGLVDEADRMLRSCLQDRLDLVEHMNRRLRALSPGPERVTRVPCELACPPRVQPDVHTESNDLGTGHVRAVRAVGQVSLHDYLQMVAPGAILMQKRAVYWMLFTLFVAGTLCGLIAGMRLV